MELADGLVDASPSTVLVTPVMATMSGTRVTLVLAMAAMFSGNMAAIDASEGERIQS